MRARDRVRSFQRCICSQPPSPKPKINPNPHSGREAPWKRQRRTTLGELDCLSGLCLRVEGLIHNLGFRILGLRLFGLRSLKLRSRQKSQKT